MHVTCLVILTLRIISLILFFASMLNRPEIRKDTHHNIFSFTVDI